MLVKNDYLNEILYVTPHAKIRWNERGGSGKLEHWLQPAVPFGGQYGKRIMLLIHDESVFVTSMERKGKRAVITVLTKTQAIANMIGASKVNFQFEMKPPPAPMQAVKIPIAELAADHSLRMPITKEHRIAELEACGHESDEDRRAYNCAFQAVEICRNKLESKYRAEAGQWMRDAITAEQACSGDRDLV